MLIAAIRDCPISGGKVKSFDAAKVQGMRGVKKVVPVGDTGVAVVADTLLERQDRARRLADRLGRRARTPRYRAPRSPTC